MTREGFVETWAAKLPPYIARREVAWFLGGAISTSVLTHADSDGVGPEGAVRVSNRVVYPTKGLLSWLVDRGYADMGASNALLDNLRRMSRDRAMSPRIRPADLPLPGERGGPDAHI